MTSTPQPSPTLITTRPPSTVTLGSASTTDITNFRVRNISDSEIEIIADYSYDGDHGPQVTFIGQATSNGLGKFYFLGGYRIQQGYGSITFRLVCSQPWQDCRGWTTDQVWLSLCNSNNVYAMYGPCFYGKAFDYSKTWQMKEAADNSVPTLTPQGGELVTYGTLTYGPDRHPLTSGTTLNEGTHVYYTVKNMSDRTLYFLCNAPNKPSYCSIQISTGYSSIRSYGIGRAADTYGRYGGFVLEPGETGEVETVIPDSATVHCKSCEIWPFTQAQNDGSPSAWPTIFTRGRNYIVAINP